MQPILVWDWPVRVGHWLLVAAFLVAWLTAESEAWRLLHVGAGGVMVGVVLFRLVWGVVGTSHARFRAFVRPFSDVQAYLSALAKGSPPHATGHNPAGGWAIVALLAMVLLTAITGWVNYQFSGWAEKLHEAFANILLVLVSLHVGGVFVGSAAHRENLIRAMVTGYKYDEPHEAINAPAIWGVPLVLAAALGCGWWMVVS